MSLKAVVTTAKHFVLSLMKIEIVKVNVIDEGLKILSLNFITDVNI